MRKDLAAVSSSGRPRVGYVRQDLIREIEQFLGYDAADDAVIAGAGKLGKALLDYKGFKDYGLNILAAFDVDERIVGTELNGKPILHISKIQDTCRRLNIRIGIITVPVEYAQPVCDQFVESGVLAVWNFAPVHLKVPEHILVQMKIWRRRLRCCRTTSRQRSRKNRRSDPMIRAGLPLHFL